MDVIDLKNPRLRKLAAAPGTAYVRVSGTWMNGTHFQNDDSLRSIHRQKGFRGVMTRAQWKGINAVRNWLDMREAIASYAKTGVMITELLPESTRQPALWGDIDRERRERVWKTMDKLNATLGRDTVRILSAGPKTPRGSSGQTFVLRDGRRDEMAAQRSRCAAKYAEGLD